MKRILSFLLCVLFLFTLPALADDAGQARIDSGIVGIWIEIAGNGTLTMRADGSSEMVYYDDTVTECTWELTDTGAVFTDDMWYNSPAVLLDENTLSVADGWMIFAREGFMATTDVALLLGAEPVGEEGIPFLGQWTLTSCTMEGEELDLAAFGMTKMLTFNADGTATIDDGYGPLTYTWFVSYDNAVLAGDVLAFTADDQITYTGLDSSMTFTKVITDEMDPPAQVDTPADAEPADAAPAPAGTPVGEEGTAFLGQWTLISIEMDGMSMDPSLLGMTMTLTFTEDGLVTISDDLDVETAAWSVENGAAIVDGSPLTLNEEGNLVMSDEGASMIFTQGTAESSGELSEADLLMALLAMLADLEEEPSSLPEEHQGFEGEWFMCYCAADGLTGDLRPLSISATLTLYDDYTGSLWCFPALEGSDKMMQDVYGSWFDADGTICFGDNAVPMYLLGDESSPAGVFLQYGAQQSGYMIFSQNEEAVWDPAAYELQPALSGAESAAQDAGSGAAYLNTRMVCSTYTAGGFTADAATLGAEYALFFREDGTADFTMAGMPMNNLPYTVTEDGVYAINYYGNMFNCVLTETGFDLDYYGAMTLHFIPAE